MQAPEGWYEDGSGRLKWWDGTNWVAAPDAEVPLPAHPRPGLSYSDGDSAGVPMSTPPRRRRTALIAVLCTAGAIFVTAAAVVLFAVITAVHWTKVDVPEQPETFRSEQYATGSFIVTNTGTAPCYVGQDWYECRNKMVDEYNRECYDRSLVATSAALCESYVEEIDRMEAVGEYGSTVASLGGYGYLRSEPEYATRQVSNRDQRSAVTHEAVCYLGFVGECDGVPSESTADLGAVQTEVDDAVEVVSTYWRDHFPEYFGDIATYQAPKIGGTYSSNDPPSCGEERLEAFNAYFCNVDDTLWWDGELMQQAYGSGDAIIYLIVAHEWGHSIQSQIDDVWVGEELQADCFAGAALYGAAKDGTFQWEPGDTAEITSGLTALADETPWTDTGDHGDPLDRIDAFNEGRTKGVEGCRSIG